MISEQVIEQIAAANDIVEVIGAYFPLKRAGATYKALCPFHREKSPSFTVNPARQIFKCFGCGAGGGVFKFVELYENVSFPEAAKRLAARAGIKIVDEPLTEEEDAKQRMRRRLLALHADAAEWFHTNLLRTKAAQSAREYLKKRGLTAEVAKSWKIGYAPEAWDALVNMARRQGYTEGELVASGLVSLREQDDPSRGCYDRFRDRVMFPICNKDTGEVIAFSGRILEADAKAAKYVNSPETMLFSKGKVLFGLHKSKRAIIDKSTAIVCEGQIDLITAFEAGVQNVTASQGTAFTRDQALILKRYASEVILCFDADNAGLNAAEKSLPALLDAGLSVRVATMPAGHDPDSLIRTEGSEAFQRQIASAKDFFEHLIELNAKSPEFTTARGKAAFARKIAESVAMVPDPMLREAIISNVSARLEIPAQQFIMLLNRQKKKPAQNSPAKTPKEKPQPVLNNAARLLCLLVLSSREARDWVLARDWENLLQDLPDTEIPMLILAGTFDPLDPSTVATFLTTVGVEEQAVLADLLSAKAPPDPKRVIVECWRDLERRKLEYRRDSLAARLRHPGIPADEVIKLQKQILDLQQQLTHITRPLSPPP